MDKKTTYGDAIAALQETTSAAYDACEGLRDCADENEKEHWNNLRRLYLAAHDELQKLSRKAYQAKRSDMEI